MSITNDECIQINRAISQHILEGQGSVYSNLDELLESVLNYKVVKDISSRKLFREQYRDYQRLAFKVLEDPWCNATGPIPRCYLIHCPCRSPIDPREQFFVCVDIRTGVQHFCSKDCALATIKD